MCICLYCAKYGVIKDVTKYSICVVIASGHHHIVVVVCLHLLKLKIKNDFLTNDSILIFELCSINIGQ